MIMLVSIISLELNTLLGVHIQKSLKIGSICMCSTIYVLWSMIMLNQYDHTWTVFTRSDTTFHIS